MQLQALWSPKPAAQPFMQYEVCNPIHSLHTLSLEWRLDTIKINNLTLFTTALCIYRTSMYVLSSISNRTLWIFSRPKSCRKTMIQYSEFLLTSRFPKKSRNIRNCLPEKCTFTVKHTSMLMDVLNSGTSQRSWPTARTKKQCCKMWNSVWYKPVTLTRIYGFYYSWRIKLLLNTLVKGKRKYKDIKQDELQQAISSCANNDNLLYPMGNWDYFTVLPFRLTIVLAIPVEVSWY
jgi:hypothetical protein